MAFYCESDGWIYYGSETAICKMKIDGTEKIKLAKIDLFDAYQLPA